MPGDVVPTTEMLFPMSV